MLQASHYDAFEREVGYIFAERQRLIEALAHASIRDDGRAAHSNERLAFLGDAVLDFVIAHELYSDPARLSRGEMNDRRKARVSNKALAELDTVLPLELGNSIRPSEVPPSVRATTIEAVIGAAYEDGGLVAAQRVARAILARGPTRGRGQPP